MRLLIIGSLNGYMGAASKIALDKGAKVVHAPSIEGGLNALRSGKGAELVFMDVQLDIATFIGSLEAERIVVPVVACGIGTDSAAAVRAIKAGAKEYVPLPPDPELIAAVLSAVTEESHALLFADPVMGRSLRLADQVAKSDATVLINGESGTGKELMARYIHRKSRRADAPFVSVNCAAIPENLLESELFGHEKGAFTGAVARRIGKFEEANGGTLLLDEITEMHPRLQAKLLRAIQERVIDRVGGGTPVKVDLRLVCTTNRTIEDEVRAGNFREDLYFRINVVNLEIPSLRERQGDIPLLAAHFVEKYAAQNDVGPRRLSREAQAALLAHPWPGNVRELENTMHRAVLLASGTDIGVDAIRLTGNLHALRSNAAPEIAAPAIPSVVAAAAAAAYGGGAMRPPPVPAAANGVVPLVGRTVAAVERDLIIDTLQHCFGNRTHAANILGISIRTLRNKLRQYADEGVRVPPPPAAAMGGMA
jgi:DNA-binding NtrC family response regulator